MCLEEIVGIILFLAQQSLAFRGHQEDEQSESKGKRSHT